MVTINEAKEMVGGRSIHYYSAGEHGSPVVLLHGGGIDSAMVSWRLTLPALAESHQVYAPDWPGYGQSEWEGGEYTLDLLIQTLGGLLDSWGLQKAALVGLSMGGGTALGYALTHPERVAKLVLVDSYGLSRRVPFQSLSYLYVKTPLVNPVSWWMLRQSRAMTRWTLGYIMANPQAITPELVDEVYEIMKRPGIERAFTAFQNSEITRQGLRTSYMDRLNELPTQTLIVHGDKDTLVPLRDAQEAAGRIRNARLEVLPNAGHWSPRDRPEQFNRLVAGFLADDSSQGG